jgi:hypothetical protein
LGKGVMNVFFSFQFWVMGDVLCHD